MSTDLLEKMLDGYVGWESAIADAEQEALKCEQRAIRLRAVASVLKRKAESGEPWPGSSRDVPPLTASSRNSGKKSATHN
jgi:hypothetical protein